MPYIAVCFASFSNIRSVFSGCSRVCVRCVIRARAHTTDKDSNIIRFPEGFAVECCAEWVFCGAEGEIECKKLNYLYFVNICRIVI